MNKAVFVSGKLLDITLNLNKKKKKKKKKKKNKKKKNKKKTTKKKQKNIERGDSIKEENEGRVIQVL